MHLLLTGSTGLVGQGVLQRCLQAGDVEHITLLVRRPVDTRESRVSQLVLQDFAQADSRVAELFGIDAAFYCAGAPPVGTRAPEYRRVTHDLTLAVARAYAKANPAGRFVYISGAGSDPGAQLMPFRIKGDTEVSLQQLPITTVMLRPGGILPADGTASPHASMRFFHALARPLQSVAVRCLPGSATTNTRIGEAMLAVARMPHPPSVVENTDINRLGAPAG